MYGIKNTLSTLVNKFNPSNQAWLFPMQTGKDVFGYLNSFQKSIGNIDGTGGDMTCSLKMKWKWKFYWKS